MLRCQLREAASDSILRRSQCRTVPEFDEVKSIGLGKKNGRKHCLRNVVATEELKLFQFSKSVMPERFRTSSQRTAHNEISITFKFGESNK